ALDKAGNGDYYRVGFTVDRTPPRIEVLGVADGAVYAGPVVPEIRIEEANPERTEILLDGAAYEPGTPIAANGTHHLAITAVDLAGNLSTLELWFTVDVAPPTTRAELAGDRWSDGVFKSPVAVSLMAEDDPGGSGVSAIYYRLDGGAEELYTGPFLVGAEGRHTLSYYALDRAGNREEKKTTEFRIVKPWTASYGLLCRSLKTKGRAQIQSAFVNGPVDLGGRVHLGYLGTTESHIRKTHHVEIGRLETGRPCLPLPEPDWATLRAATRLRTETRISGEAILSGVRFAKGLYLSGKVRITGLLVVEGDLTIAGHLELAGGAVYCRGKVKVTGCATIEGLLYAGCGLEVGGTLDLRGAAVVDGPANLYGRVTVVKGPIEDYPCWLRPGEDGCWCGHGPHHHGHSDGHKDGGHWHDDDPPGRKHQNKEGC
ncbi:MAG: hypothetical protein K6U03_05765, partial [Firmicutes bacterium]|nr:hypothetical protein [Bacillota bacterium]